MIAISEALIRNARTLSGNDSPREQSSGDAQIQAMMSTSPPQLPTLASAADLAANAANDEDGMKVQVVERKKTDNSADSVPVAKQMERSDFFAKIDVKKQAPAVSSSLSKNLERGGLATSVRGGGAFAAAGGWLNLEVFTGVGEPPLKMKVQQNTTVDEVIDLIIRQHTEQHRKPPLAPDSDMYELRMLEEDDGTPDTDIPPLEREGIISKFGIDAVALCIREDQEMMVDTRMKRGISLEINNRNMGKKKFVKIHMPNHVSHVLPVTDEKMTLKDIFPLIAKKRSTADDDEIGPRQYKFTYLDESTALEMEMNVNAIRSDELKLVRRVAKEAELQTIPEDLEQQPIINLTQALAHQYTEFPVIKINQWGRRQERVLGIDGKGIHNRNPGSVGVLGRRISMDVRKAFRPISEIQSITEIGDTQRAFRIVFRLKDDLDVREYEADSKMDCAQMVAKIRFLMEEHEKQMEIAANVK